MELAPVESSNLEAVGYDAETFLLRVLFKDGGLYDIENVSPAVHAVFMQAKSKGGFYARYLAHLAKRSGSETVRQVQTPLQPNALQSYVEDDCCGKPIARAMLAGALNNVDSWICPKCGTEWRPRQVDTIRHWEPREFFARL